MTSSSSQAFEEQRVLPRDSPFVGSLRHAPQQVLAGQLDRLLRRRVQVRTTTGYERSHTSCSSGASVFQERLQRTSPPEKLPPSSPYVGFQRHAPPSPVLNFSDIAGVPPGLQLPSLKEEQLLFVEEFPGGLPEEVWCFVVCMAVEVPTLGTLSRVSRGLQKVVSLEASWRGRVIRVLPSCLPNLAPQLDRWLTTWNSARKLVLPRSTQLLQEVAERAPHLAVEVSWRFDQCLKGQGVEVLKHGSCVRRLANAEEELVVLGDAALPAGPRGYPYLEVMLDECGEGIGDNINDFGFGVTACDPEEIEHLGSVADEVPRSWVVDFTKSMVYLSINNREAGCGKRLSALDLKQGSRVGLLVKPTSLEVYVNGVLGEIFTPIAEEQVPLGALYPVLDLYGRVIQISKTDAEEPVSS